MHCRISRLLKQKMEYGNEKSKLINDKKDCCKIRYLLAILVLFGFSCAYAMRVNLNVALVAMVNQTYVKNQQNIETHSPECHVLNLTTPMNIENEDGKFKWDEKMQGIILGSFYYGYIFTQIPGGYVAEKYGAKRVLGFGILGTAILTLLTPLAARTHVYLLIATRILEGLFEGVTYPANHALWGKWAPVMERSKLTIYAFAGTQLGIVVSLPVSALLSKYGFDGGWPSVFYVTGTFSCLWFILWMLLASDSPQDHPHISEHERIYIESSIGDPQVYSNPPLKSILTSKPFWAIIVAHFSFNWGLYTFLTGLPTYMKNILGYNIANDGLISAIPYIACFSVTLIASVVADYLREKHILSTTKVRKIFNSIGFLIPVIFLLALGSIKCDDTLAIVLLAIVIGTCGIAYSGFSINHLDISSRYAGFLQGLTNTTATIPGIVSPSVIGALTFHNQTREQWQKVFYITAGVYAFGTIFYLIFASGEKQPWNDHEFHGKQYSDEEYIRLVKDRFERDKVDYNKRKYQQDTFNFME